MVVATPCPLILAAPIAFVAGLSRAARAGIIVKGGGALERLGTAKTVLLDKTGTLTLGQPELEDDRHLRPAEHADEVLRLAASVDQMSTHVLAESLVSAAAARGLPLVASDRRSPRMPAAASSARSTGRPSPLARAPGSRATATSGVRDRAREHDAGDGAGRAKILVGIDGELAAVIVMGDRLRPGAETLARELESVGVDERGAR